MDKEEGEEGESEEYGLFLSSSISAAYRSLRELANRELRAELKSAGGGGGGAHTTYMIIMTHMRLRTQERNLRPKLNQ